MVFSPVDQQVIHFTSAKRHTITDDSSKSMTWFDIMTLTKPQSFPFTDIIMLPSKLPQSVHGTICVAAAVLREELSDETLRAVWRCHRYVDLFCQFQRVIYFAVSRPFSYPPNPNVHDSEPRIILGSFQRMKVFLR